jgi:phosphopantothenoylcysteine synthetase/decarboxylase
MAQTFLDLQNQALGPDDFDPGRYRAEAKQAIIDAIGEIARSTRLPANETSYTIPVVAGTQDYTLPTGASGTVRVLSVIDTQTADPLQDITESTLDDLASSRGRPVAFSLYGANLSLYPTPDQTYSLTLRYLRQGGVPANDTDPVSATTGIPEDYLHALVEYARHRLFRKEDDFEAANYWEGQYRQSLQRLKADVQRRDVGAKRRVPSMWQGTSGPRFVRP